MATLNDLAALIDGDIIGDASVEITRLAPIDGAGPGDITFIANPKYLPFVSKTAASAILVDRPLDREDIAYLVCKNPYLAFAKILTHLNVQRLEPLGVLPGAQVAPSAVLGKGITVHPGAVVGEGVEIGDGSILYPNVVVYDQVKIGCDCQIHAGSVIREGCVVGDRVIVQPNAVIGSDGFGFAPDGEAYYKIPQVGIVVIEDDVEIGAGSCIDRAAMGVTRISEGCKLDNMVQVAHNVTVGPHTVMASQSGIAGSAKVGRHCTVGGQAAITGHITVGDNVTLGGRGGIAGNMDGNQVVSGIPAIPHKEWLKSSMVFPKLPQMKKEITALKRQLEALQAKIEEE
ncbi:UDP-3-O-(3-hydroxymyristoyl)glucosamine N-acyltransferase [uncultured Desulfuromonas sp.]|uniref:UDP-3-O-(3-hydroxymyristoyl)glucosamine N-acyltransferase n=1 Tax=uncultured Desulfuromonas sp. TaxID=181013 RepID=UPI002AAAC9BE|nr:UDP-3-O-(3-hydroxymyristoyl)glucosamine N-acyltransferase [uncultured Desulfuromonas sp.]